MSVRSVLRDLGFTTDEIDIYLYLLRHGASSQQDISDGMGVVRQTIYNRLGKMERKGYVTYVKQGNSKQYSAEEPQTLLRRFRGKVDKFEDELPALEAMQEQDEPRVRSECVTGLKGVKNLTYRSLASSTELLWIDNMAKAEARFDEHYWLNMAQKRSQKDIPLKMITEPTDKTHWNTDTSIDRETKQASIVNDLNASFLLFEDKAILYSFDEEQLFGVYIQNQSIKDSLEQIFWTIWDNAEPTKELQKES